MPYPSLAVLIHEAIERLGLPLEDGVAQLLAYCGDRRADHWRSVLMGDKEPSDRGDYGAIAYALRQVTGNQAWTEALLERHEAPWCHSDNRGLHDSAT